MKNNDDTTNVVRLAGACPVSLSIYIYIYMCRFIYLWCANPGRRISMYRIRKCIARELDPKRKGRNGRAETERASMNRFQTTLTPKPEKLCEYDFVTKQEEACFWVCSPNAFKLRSRLSGERSLVDEAQKCPWGEVPLVFVPVGTPGGQPSNQK